MAPSEMPQGRPGYKRASKGNTPKHPPIRITDANVERLPFEPFGYTAYYDTQLQGFCVQVGTASKTYYARKAVKGKPVAYAIGTNREITADEARRVATAALERIAEGATISDLRGSERMTWKRRAEPQPRAIESASNRALLGLATPEPGTPLPSKEDADVLAPAQPFQPSLAAYRAPKKLPTLSELLAAVPDASPAALARYLGVTERTICSWKANGIAPRAAMLALYWETAAGQRRSMTNRTIRPRADLDAIIDELPQSLVMAKGEQRTVNTMLSLPKIGPDMFRDLTDFYGGVGRATKALRISPELFNVWYSGQREAPHHVLLALWFIGPYGFNQAFCESHWTHQYNSFLKNKAIEEAQRLQAVLERVKLAIGSDHPALAPPQQEVHELPIMFAEPDPQPVARKWAGAHQ